MIKIPFTFDGAKFAKKYNLDPFKDFHDDGNGYLICPSLPDLTDADLLDCIADPLQDKEIFSKPIQTPAIYADDVFVSSRKIKDDPDEALQEAINEAEKPEGTAKSLDLIARSTIKIVEQQRRKIKDLEAAIIELEKKIKKLDKQ